ncbi:hypothetical protein GWI33_021271 [Rhynchophorus ferrugineus]|uniref:Uncharacterized protein n=1 Tax=Rhynchophorus ferrugineus TaxID=354439 RepID=A0A834HPX0_RHYFE|nr:hypothetical protein GWI33_021271 [Rhynchophorus ferrugineus]
MWFNTTGARSRYRPSRVSSSWSSSSFFWLVIGGEKVPALVQCHVYCSDGERALCRRLRKKILLKFIAREIFTLAYGYWERWCFVGGDGPQITTGQLYETISVRIFVEDVGFG